MDPKERVKDFNQHFLTLRNKILETSRPINDVTIKFYTSSLPPSMAMFMKRTKKETFNENFEEAIKVENDLITVHDKNEIDDERPSTSRRKQRNQEEI
jgi:hypothetical protein